MKILIRARKVCVVEDELTGIFTVIRKTVAKYDNPKDMFHNIHICDYCLKQISQEGETELVVFSDINFMTYYFHDQCFKDAERE